ncbi:unnamed protein product [Prunus armeniaca]|uniref:Uncharacterized protein n=1 Tax=Prunus armeniaca TaxID=36596 RepID=A0A6J5UNF8_PRUAR|nr:unnamed protein product [Prunus armeniaca]
MRCQHSLGTTRGPASSSSSTSGSLVEELNISSPGHVLYGFYNTPPLDTEISFEFNALHVRGWDGCT